MQKKIHLISILFVVLSLFSCTQNNQRYFQIGNRLDQIPGNIHSLFEYHNYWFFEYKNRNYVVLTDGEFIVDVHSYPIREVTRQNFERVESGMMAYEVVELVGLPYYSYPYTSFYNMFFKTSDGKYSYDSQFIDSKKDNMNLYISSIRFFRELDIEYKW